MLLYQKLCQTQVNQTCEVYCRGSINEPSTRRHSTNTELHELNTFGRHLLVEYRGCDREVLNDLEYIETIMNQAALAANATIVRSTFHPFMPHGVSGVVVVQESHLSIHTWPEYGYAAVDFFTCGDTSPEAAHESLLKALKAESSELMLVHRGLSIDGPGGLQIEKHVDEDSTDESSAPLKRVRMLR